MHAGTENKPGGSSKVRIKAALVPLGTVSAMMALYGSCGTGMLDKASTRSATSDGPQAHVCASDISLASLIEPQISCYAPQTSRSPSIVQLHDSRKLTPWIPCNDVQLVSMASNATFDFDGAISFIAAKDHFSINQIRSALTNPERPLPGLAAHPALNSPHHAALVELIRSAKETIFFNAIIFGGAWGSELIREMMIKHQQGVSVTILRDTENSFAFANELNPVWNELKAFGLRSERFTVLRADINSRPLSAIPLGIDQITRLLSGLVGDGISLSGRSDHSKILIVDAFTPTPGMLVASKNPSDYNLLNYDESALVRGPAAAAAMIDYIPDLKAAQALAHRESDSRGSQQISAEDDEHLKQIYTAADQAKDPSTRGLRFKPMGLADVRLSSNNVDNTVQNTEMSVLQLISGAQRNLRIYNFLAYNPKVARAVAQAIQRLGAEQVRVLADATLTYSLNLAFDDMLRYELKDLGEQHDPERLNASLRWRVTRPPTRFENSSDRIDITQQQHTKSIIVDDTVIYLGSTNFDYASLGGAFRELSISIRDQRAATSSAALFDALWNDPQEAVSTEQIQLSVGPTGAFTPPAALRSAFINLIKAEQSRLGALDPSHFDRPESCN